MSLYRPNQVKSVILDDKEMFMIDKALFILKREMRAGTVDGIDFNTLDVQDLHSTIVQYRGS